MLLARAKNGDDYSPPLPRPLLPFPRGATLALVIFAGGVVVSTSASSSLVVSVCGVVVRLPRPLVTPLTALALRLFLGRFRTFLFAVFIFILFNFPLSPRPFSGGFRGGFFRSVTDLASLLIDSKSNALVRGVIERIPKLACPGGKIVIDVTTFKEENRAVPVAIESQAELVEAHGRPYKNGSQLLADLIPSQAFADA